MDHTVGGTLPSQGPNGERRADPAAAATQTIQAGVIFRGPGSSGYAPRFTQVFRASAGSAPAVEQRTRCFDTAAFHDDAGGATPSFSVPAGKGSALRRVQPRHAARVSA